MPLFRELCYCKFCVGTLLLPAVPLFSTNFRIFEHKLTRLGWTSDSVYNFSTIVAILYFICKRVKFAPDGIYVVHKTWNFGYIQAPQSESAQHKWSSWTSNYKLLSYLSSVKSAPCSSSLSFRRYGQFCVTHWETFMSRAFSEFFNIVKISQKFVIRTCMETLHLVV